MDHTPENGNQERREESYSPQQAARVLGVSDERIRQLIDSGDLEGEKRRGRWFIHAVSVHDALKERGSPRGRRPPQTGENAAREAAELRSRVEDLSYRLGRTEARAELTEQAESTVRDQLEREQKRADRLEDELREARERLEEARQEAGRSWWRRLFGGG